MPYRGAGRPEAIYLIERLIDHAAREMNIEPVEFRRRNFISHFPYQTHTGWTYDSGDYVQPDAYQTAPVTDPHSSGTSGRAYYRGQKTN